MQKVIFYAVVILIGIGIYVSLYGPRKPTTVTSSGMAPQVALEASPMQSAGLKSPSPTLIPKSAFGKYADVPLPDLVKKARSVVKTWDTDNASKKGMPDDEVLQLTLALGQAANGTPEDADAQALIGQLSIRREARSATAEAAAAQMRIANNVAARTSFADQLERTYLGKGMDVTVRTSGSKKTTLTLSYVLMGRPTVYQLGNDEDFLSSLRGIGFKMIVFTDGYDSTWKLDLVKNKFL